MRPRGTKASPPDGMDTAPLSTLIEPGEPQRLARRLLPDRAAIYTLGCIVVGFVVMLAHCGSLT